jgi:hypothetical protein
MARESNANPDNPLEGLRTFGLRSVNKTKTYNWNAQAMTGLNYGGQTHVV